MDEISVGKILNLIYNTENKSLRVLIEITDDIFKEEILRSQSLGNKIKFVGDEVMYIATKKKEE